MRFSLLNISLPLVLLAFLSFGCEKDEITISDIPSSQNEQKNAEIAGPFQKSRTVLTSEDLLELAKAESKTQELVDEVFTTLAEAPGLKTMDLAEQGLFLQLNMPSFKADALNLDAAYNDAYANYRPNENGKLEPYLNDIHNIAFVNAISAENAILKLEQYEEILISGQFDLDVEELKNVLQEVYCYT